MTDAIEICMNPKLLALATLIVSATASADSTLRCGNSLISVGDTKFKLVMKCGEPIGSTSKEIIVLDEYGFRTAVIKETLTIDMGKDRLLGLVSVVDGVITSIEDGPRNN